MFGIIHDADTFQCWVTHGFALRIRHGFGSYQLQTQIQGEGRERSSSGAVLASFDGLLADFKSTFHVFWSNACINNSKKHSSGATVSHTRWWTRSWLGIRMDCESDNVHMSQKAVKLLQRGCLWHAFEANHIFALHTCGSEAGTTSFVVSIAMRPQLKLRMNCVSIRFGLLEVPSHSFAL